MKNFYYLIWSSAILRFKEHHPYRDDWKTAVFTQMTFVNSLNLWVVFLWLKYFDIFIIPPLDINILADGFIASAIAYLIQFALPIGIVNYFFIFHNERYQKIILKYKDIETNYAFNYSVLMVFLALFSALLYSTLTYY